MASEQTTVTKEERRKRILKKLGSRKLWAAITGAIPMIATGNYGEAAAIIIGYIVTQGAVDAAESIRLAKD